MTDDDKFPMHIGVERVTENEDGSATYTFHMSDEASEEMQQLGLKLILYCGTTQTDIQDVFDWILAREPYIRPFDAEETQRAKEREKANSLQTCVSCGNPSTSDFCEFCLEEE